MLVVAVAMTFVIITGGIDLSVGSQVALVNAVAAILLAMGFPGRSGGRRCSSSGALIGLAQGWFIAYQGIPAFIVTLGGPLDPARRRALADPGLLDPDHGRAGLLRARTRRVPRHAGPGADRGRRGRARLCRHLARPSTAARSSPSARTSRQRAGSACRRSGSSPRSTSVTGVASALAGLLIAARLGSGSSNAAVGFELQVIAAVVLGGTSLMGGRGTILGTVLGTLTIAVIGNGLILMHISPFFTQIVTGAIILVAIWLNTRIFTANFRFAAKGRGESMASELSEAHVRSGKVMTVAGPIPAAELGITLMHEHILNDCRCWWNPPKTPERQYLADSFVCIEILGELRQDPFVNTHNITLDDEPLAIAELKAFASAGGRTVVDPTCRGIGRNPRALRRISQATGLNIVMGAGYYLAVLASGRGRRA